MTSSARPRLCRLCGERRGRNPDCPRCAARRLAHRRRMRGVRAGDKAGGLRSEGCGDPPDAGFETCSVCRGKARQRGRMKRLRQLPY